MKRSLVAFLLLSLPAFAQDQAPQTFELPVSVVQGVMQFLSFDRGRAAVSVLREIDDCLKNQGPTIVQMAGQADLCPAVTATIKARADAQAAAAVKTSKPKAGKQGTSP